MRKPIIETLFSETREKKYLDEARKIFIQGIIDKLKAERIEYLTSKIQEEKDAILDCLNQNFFDMAKCKLERIEKMNKEINNTK